MEDINEEASECKRVLLQNEQAEDAESSDLSSESRKHQSCTAFCGLFSSVVRNLNCKRKKKRPDQVELTCTPHNGLMVQMISSEEEKEQSVAVEEPEICTLQVAERVERRPSRHETDEGGRSLFLPRVTSFSGGQEAEERLLSRVAGRTPTASSRPRFLTLHKRRKRKPPTRGLLLNSALLDDLYNGPTQCVLSRVALWDFNAFALDSVCGGRPVAVLCVFLLHEYNLINEFNLDTVTVWKCFSLIEEGYHASNPYHNAIHAADVTQAMHCYLQENAIAQHLTSFEKLAAIIASVCHDLDHPGVNQPFLIATDNHLAALYNNASVLENHHWRCAMGCLWESGMIDNWAADDVALLQEEIRSLILATDITRQNEFLSKFKKYQESGTLDMTLSECRHFSLQIALKCADICNPCRPWEVSRQWSHKICDEFYRQGDYERQLRLPVTSLCDRYVNSVAKIQTGFIKFVVSPLFESWNSWLKTELSETMQIYLRENLIHWENFLLEERRRQEEEPKQPSISSTSSSSQTSVMGATEPTATLCPALGRRYSLPLTVPSLLPRTVIRRESLCEPTLIHETVRMGEMSVESVVAPPSQEEETQETTEDRLYPEPTIAAMGEVGRPRKPKIGRRQSLPPLWDASFVPTRMLRPLEALPATPLQEETPTETEKEVKPTGCEPSSSGAAPSLSQVDSANQCSTGSAREEQQQQQRRSSLDSAKRPRLDNDPPKVSHSRRDKENVAPHILKTRLWRSLNHEEEVSHDNRTKISSYKNINQNYSRGRRGSAPILKLETLRGGLRGGTDINPDYLSRRRGSAPSNQIHLHLGSDALRLHQDEKLCQVPLLSRENLLPDEGDRNGNFGGPLISPRRGSVPTDVRTDALSELNNQNKLSDLNFGRPGPGRGNFGGGELSLHPSHIGNVSLPENRRGSTGFELLSGLWRYHLEGVNSNSLCSDDSMGLSSSGGATPGTPGTIGPLASFQVSPSLLPHPYYRRGSLPTDAYTAVDGRRWANEAS